ncbi:MAG: GAF domain-containing protein [Chloroflexi bacterium]|nr:GAF domain-containing protein [Chloroflexota bacterium]
MATQYENLGESHNTDEVVFSARELAVLNEIATVVSSATDMSDVYSSFSALVADVIDWDGIIVNTPCDDGKKFLIRVREGEMPVGRTPGNSFEIEGSLFGEVKKYRTTQIVSVSEDQTAEWALRIPGIRSSLLSGYRSFMATPLLSQGNMVGVIYVQSLKPDAFTAHDQMVIERIAMFVGPTIGRFEAYERLRREELNNQSLLRIGHLLLGAAHFGDVIEQFVEELKAVVDVDRLSIAVIQSDEQTLKDRWVFGIPITGYGPNTVYPIDSLASAGLDITSHGYIFDVGDITNPDSVLTGGMRANYEAGLRSAMFAGLHTQGRLVGTINVKSVRDDAYMLHHLVYFEQLAGHIAASLDRSLVREAEIEMSQTMQERRRAEQEALRVMDVIHAKERLLTSASHELRTPLTGILAFVDLLARNRSGNLVEKEIRYLSIVRRNAEDLSAKVNSLIAHAERDAGELNITLEVFDLAVMLRDVVTDTVPKLAQSGQSVEISVSDSLEIVGDRRQLLVAVTHLIDNASRYAPKESTILLEGEQISTNIEISVSDQGTGVPTAHASDIFDPFERGELTGMASSPGAGLGLTYVRAVAVGHGGDVTYGRTSDGGAKFTISIPERASTQF